MPKASYAYAFVHSPGMKTAPKQAEKVDVWHEYSNPKSFVKS
ncbi:MAG: hypothetical protein V7L14_12535 [Nostoc sp.]